LFEWVAWSHTKEAAQMQGVWE